jgi:hypothetical protein
MRAVRLPLRVSWTSASVVADTVQRSKMSIKIKDRRSKIVEIKDRRDQRSSRSKIENQRSKISNTTETSHPKPVAVHKHGQVRARVLAHDHVGHRRTGIRLKKHQWCK